jgi:predicted Zn-dependent peptidase
MSGVSLPVESFNLGNRPRVLCQPDKRTPVAVVRLCLLAGSRYESPERRGLAHLCEHLAWQGDHGEAQSFLELIYGAGGSTNGWTLHDQTSFAEAVPSRQLPLALGIEAQRLSLDALSLTPKRIQKERATLIQEWNERANHPYSRELERLSQLLYPPHHPYHYPAGGLPQGIEAITPADIHEYLHTCYRPERAVVVVAGDIAPDDVARRAEELFTPEPARDPAPRQPNLAPPRGEHRAVIAAAVPYVRTYLAYRGPARSENTWHPVALLAKSVATGRANPLHRELVESEGLAYEIRLHMEPMQEASTVAFIATAPAETPHERLEAALIAAIDRMVNGDLEPAQLEKARKAALIEYYSNIQKLGARADRLAWSALFEDGGLGLEHEREHIQHVQFERVMDAGRRYFVPERRAVLSVVPSRSAS